MARVLQYGWCKENSNEILHFQRSTIYIGYRIVLRQEGYAIEAEIAGYGDDDIRVSVKDGTLTISSTETLKDRIQKRREARSIISSEIATPQFSRSFSLPEDADRNAIEAESRNGILTIRIPKVVRKDPGRIEIKIGK